jgi:hypothetical protein
MVYFKFNTKKEALDFCLKVNQGEDIVVTEEKVTTNYAQPFEYELAFYVIADEVTSKYTDDEPIDIFAPVDKTPPTMSGLKVEIPSYWEVFFPDDTFILNGFIVQLERINGALAVDIAYLQWANFQAELDKPSNEAVKRHMMPIWDYVIEQINNNNFIQTS